MFFCRNRWVISRRFNLLFFQTKLLGDSATVNACFEPSGHTFSMFTLIIHSLRVPCSCINLSCSCESQPGPPDVCAGVSFDWLQGGASKMCQENICKSTISRRVWELKACGLHIMCHHTTVSHKCIIQSCTHAQPSVCELESHRVAAERGWMKQQRHRKTPVMK